MQNASLECKLNEAERARVEAARVSEESIRLLDEIIEALDLQVFDSTTSLMHWPFLSL